MRNALLALLLAGPAAATGSICERTLPREGNAVSLKNYRRVDGGRFGIVDYVFYARKGEANVTAIYDMGTYPDLGAIAGKWAWEVGEEVYVRREGPGTEREPVCVRKIVPGLRLQGLYERLKPKLQR